MLSALRKLPKVFDLERRTETFRVCAPLEHERETILVGYRDQGKGSW